jgi:hypothetical protein
MMRFMTNDTATMRQAEVELRKFLRNPHTVPVLLELLGASANLNVGAVRSTRQQCWAGMGTPVPPRTAHP